MNDGKRPGAIALLRSNEVLLVVCVSSGVVMLGQGVTSPILPLLARTFGISTAAVGLTLSAFAAARLVFNLPAGIAADRFGRRPLMLAGPLIVGLGNVLSATAGSIEVLLAWRFVAGAGSAIYMIAAATVISDIADGSNRGTMLSLNLGALLLGVSVGPVVGGVVAEIAGLRAPFLLVGGLAIIAAFWNFVRVRETLDRKTPEGDHPVVRPHAQRRQGGQTMELLANRSFLLVGFVTMAVFMARTGGNQTLLPILGVEDRGLSAASIGLVFAVIAGLNLVTVVPSGNLVDSFGAKAVMVPSTIVTASGFAMFALTDGPYLFVLSAVVLGLGSGFMGAAPQTYAVGIVPEGNRGFAMGIYRSMADLGFVVAGPSLGLIADQVGFGWALAVAAGLLLASVGAFAALGEDEIAKRARIVEEAVPAAADGV